MLEVYDKHCMLRVYDKHCMQQTRTYGYEVFLITAVKRKIFKRTRKWKKADENVYCVMCTGGNTEHPFLSGFADKRKCISFFERN